MYTATQLTQNDIFTLYHEGVLKDLVSKSREYFNRGTYSYGALDYTPEQIAAASDDAHTAEWLDMTLGYVNRTGGVVIGTYVNNYLVGLFMGFIEDGEYNLCVCLFRPDADNTKNFLFIPEYHNVLGELEKSLGATVSYTYVEIGSPINDNLTAWINYFKDIEESNVKNWGSMVNLGEVTQTYEAPEGGRDGTKDTWTGTFLKYKMEYY